MSKLNPKKDKEPQKNISEEKNIVTYQNPETGLWEVIKDKGKKFLKERKAWLKSKPELPEPKSTIKENLEDNTRWHPSFNIPGVRGIYKNGAKLRKRKI